MFARVMFLLTTVLLFVLAFTAPVFAAAAASADEGSLLGLARPIFDAVVNGQYAFAAATALVLGVALLRRYAPGRAGEFARSGPGGAILTLVGAFGGALATAFSAHGFGFGSITGSLLWSATTVAVAAAGGYVLIKEIIVEPFMGTDWYKNKAPAWLKAALSLIVLWVFTKPDAVGEAEKAGDAAVAADPGKGADGAIGSPTDVD